MRIEDREKVTEESFSLVLGGFHPREILGKQKRRRKRRKNNSQLARMLSPSEAYYYIIIAAVVKGLLISKRTD